LPDQRETGGGGADLIIADRGMAFRMPEHFAAKMTGKHLGAEADAEIGLVFLQRHTDPVGLALDELVGIVGAHRAAEDNRGGMIGHRRR
jgi:hypothetical protein